MYCPLCASEFRDGFTTCSDCHVALVATLEEAEARRVRYWKGAREEKLDRILGALDAEKIPFHFKEIVNVHVHFRLMGIPIGKKRPTILYEVWIFRRDLERAKKAVAQAIHNRAASD